MKSKIEANVLKPVPMIIWIIKVVERIAIGSFEADSISVIDDTLLSIERLLRIENTAAASVDDIIEHNNIDF